MDPGGHFVGEIRTKREKIRDEEGLAPWELETS